MRRGLFTAIFAGIASLFGRNTPAAMPQIPATLKQEAMHGAEVVRTSSMHGYSPKVFGSHYQPNQRKRRKLNRQRGTYPVRR